MASARRLSSALGQGLAAALGRFGRDRRGNFGMIAALSAIPLILAMGGGVDYSNALRIRTDVQSAADAAALAAAKYTGTDAAERQRQADMLFKANIKSDIDVTSTKLTVDGKTFTYDAAFTVPTPFLTLMHIDSLKMTVEAVSQHSDLPLDIALVLDTTGSMGENGKMTQLKAAVKLFVANFEGSTGDAKVQVAMVPFDTQIKLNNETTAYYGVPNTATCSLLKYTTDQKYCNTSLAGFTAGSSATYTSGSTIYVYQTTKTTSTLTTVRTTQSCFWGFCWNTGSETVFSAGQTKVTGPLSGCVTDRTQPYDTLPDAPNISNTATLYIPADTCQATLAPVVGLTSNLDSIATAVDTLDPTGSTNITIGVQWGMEALTGTAPLTGANTDPKTRRIMIVLTDGDNTQNRWTSNSTQIDARTTAACTNAKAMKNPDNNTTLELYTIRVIDGNEALLKSCATDAGHYYSVKQASDLTAVFQDIAERVKRIRIVS
ncbi:pilus assembly protein TadG-related protein [Jiella sp. M17.18]|uniref:pilus assembly protein TadG-related protein n=1 Tax=Jiella sp. M17.18 TaxID=3234247 RepID=UPI0034DF831D